MNTQKEKYSWNVERYLNGKFSSNAMAFNAHIVMRKNIYDITVNIT